jgi:hypothetical protein
MRLGDSVHLNKVKHVVENRRQVEILDEVLVHNLNPAGHCATASGCFQRSTGHIPGDECSTHYESKTHYCSLFFDKDSKYFEGFPLHI